MGESLAISDSEESAPLNPAPFGAAGRKPCIQLRDCEQAEPSKRNIDTPGREKFAPTTKPRSGHPRLDWVRKRRAGLAIFRYLHIA